MAEANTEYKTYANFNSVSFTGRVVNVDIVRNNDGEYAAFTLITNLQDGEGNDINVTFNNSNGLLKLHKKGVMDRRIITVTGHIARCEQVYTNKNGERMELKRPRIHLIQAQVLDGGLGPIPKAKDGVVRKPGAVLKAPEVDPTPSIAEEAKEVPAVY